MAWAETNLDPREVDVDRAVCIEGLTAVLRSAGSNVWIGMNLFHDPNHAEPLPSGYDVYVLGYWSDVFHDAWFADMYNRHSQSQFVMLTDLESNDLGLLDRVKVIKLLHWQWFLPHVLPSMHELTSRRYKISSLAHRITHYRLYVTAALLDQPDVLVRWHAALPPESNHDWMFGSTGHPRRDSLRGWFERLSRPYNVEAFVNDPGHTITSLSSNPAYADSLVNCVNETKDVSTTPHLGSGPGAYFSEKTWKCLINGNALLFSAQAGLYQTLERAGFRFDYPWSNGYNDIWDDMDRLEATLLMLDQILAMSHEQISQGIRPSVIHNRDHIRSGDLQRYIDSVNGQGLEDLKKTLDSI